MTVLQLLVSPSPAKFAKTNIENTGLALGVFVISKRVVFISMSFAVNMLSVVEGK